MTPADQAGVMAFGGPDRPARLDATGTSGQDDRQ